MDEKILELSKPFEPECISWLPGATNKDRTKAMVMAYADLRAYMNRLDDVFGAEWSNTVTPWGDKLIVTVTINGVSRSSTGEPDSESVKSGNAGTVTEAQAFKRACAMWGLGRYLYELPSAWVAFDAENKRIPDQEIKNLNKRYADWYARQSTAQPKAVMPAAAKPYPTEWKTPADAQRWAIDGGFCGNEFEAKHSFKNSLRDVTGQDKSLDSTHLAAVLSNFYEKHINRKSEQLQELKKAA